MVVAVGLRDGKADGDFVEEGRVGERHAEAAEIVAGLEQQLIPANRDGVARQQGAVGAAIAVGPFRLDQGALTAFQREQLQPQPRRRAARAGVQDMRAQAGHVVLTSSGWS